jgi:hypothetical protein
MPKRFIVWAVGVAILMGYVFGTSPSEVITPAGWDGFIAIVIWSFANLMFTIGYENGKKD